MSGLAQHLGTEYPVALENRLFRCLVNGTVYQAWVPRSCPRFKKALG